MPTDDMVNLNYQLKMSGASSEIAAKYTIGVQNTAPTNSSSLCLFIRYVMHGVGTKQNVL